MDNMSRNRDKDVRPRTTQTVLYHEKQVSEFESVENVLNVLKSETKAAYQISILLAFIFANMYAIGFYLSRGLMSGTHYRFIFSE